jgi:predicted dienelactone hydrolase
MTSSRYLMGFSKNPLSSLENAYLWIVDNLDLWVIDHPRDILFALDQIASSPLEGLEGVIDTDRVGVVGYSAEGVDAFAVSGVRVDPEFYLSRCKEAPAMEPALPELWELYIEITCNLAQMQHNREGNAPKPLLLTSRQIGLHYGFQTNLPV